MLCGAVMLLVNVLDGAYGCEIIVLCGAVMLLVNVLDGVYG